VTVAVTLTWSLGPGAAGVIVGVLILGPGGGAATMAIAGSNSTSERTNAMFFVTIDNIFFPGYHLGL
jgi:hypothetical protein